MFSCVVLLLHVQLISFLDSRAPTGPLTQISQHMQVGFWQPAVQKQQMFKQPLDELSGRLKFLYLDPWWWNSHPDELNGWLCWESKSCTYRVWAEVRRMQKLWPGNVTPHRLQAHQCPTNRTPCTPTPTTPPLQCSSLRKQALITLIAITNT